MMDYYMQYVQIDFRQDIQYREYPYFDEEDAKKNTVNGKTIYQHIVDITKYDSNLQWLRRSEMGLSTINERKQLRCELPSIQHSHKNVYSIYLRQYGIEPFTLEELEYIAKYFSMSMNCSVSVVIRKYIE